MEFKLVAALAGGPGAADEAREVVAHRGERVVDGEERVGAIARCGRRFPHVRGDAVAEVALDDARIGAFTVGDELQELLGIVDGLEDRKTAIHDPAGLAGPRPVGHLESGVAGGKSAPGGDLSDLEVDDEAGGPVDEDRECERPEPSVVLEGFEFVEAERAEESAVESRTGEEDAVEIAQCGSEEPESAVDGFSIDAEHSRSLPVGDLGDETGEDEGVEVGFEEAEIEAERLGGEAVAAGAAAESLDASSVHAAAEEAVAMPVEGGAGARRTGGTRAEGG